MSNWRGTTPSVLTYSTRKRGKCEPDPPGTRVTPHKSGPLVSSVLQTYFPLTIGPIRKMPSFLKSIYIFVSVKKSYIYGHPS